jgi:hypothetical protein
MESYLSVERTEELIHAMTWVNTESMLSVKPGTSHRLYDPSSTKRQEEANPKRSSVEGEWSRDGWQWVVVECSFSFSSFF